MTMTSAWNRNSSYYGSLPAMNIDNNNNNSNHDERRTLMDHSMTMPPKSNDTKGKRLIAFLVVLTVLSMASSSLLLLVFIAQSSENNLGDLFNRSADASPWGWFQIRSAQQVADEALERMNNRMLEENVGGSTTSSSSNTNFAVVAMNNSPDNALVNLNKDNNSNNNKNKKLHEGCEATVVIVRHCEKAHIREHCAYIGYERSVYLATQFGDDHNERWPAPSYIFALAPGGRNNAHKMNFREIETAGPLAKKTGVKVNYAYDQEDDQPLAQHVHGLLHSGEMCGKVAFISWKHSMIGHLAHLLGCGPQQHCPIDYKGTTFDPVWTIQFSYRRLLHSDHKSLTLPKHGGTPKWYVTGSVQYENFDPLAFSKRSGDYPKGGRSTGAAWEDRAEMIPERTKKSSNKWFMDGSAKFEYLGVGPSDNDDSIKW